MSCGLMEILAIEIIWGFSTILRAPPQLQIIVKLMPLALRNANSQPPFRVHFTESRT